MQVAGVSARKDAAVSANNAMTFKRPGWRSRAFLAAFLMGLAPALAQGQAISIEYDLNTPAYRSEGYEGAPDLDYSRRLSMRVGYLSRNFANSDRTQRWSLYFSHRGLDTTPLGIAPEVRHYSANSVEAGYERLVFKRPWTCVSFGVTAGAAVVTYKDIYSRQCDTLLCNSSDGGLFLSGVGTCVIPVTPKIGFVIGARGWLLSKGREAMFPFESGPVLSVGLQLS